MSLPSACSLQRGCLGRDDDGQRRPVDWAQTRASGAYTYTYFNLSMLKPPILYRQSHSLPKSSRQTAPGTLSEPHDVLERTPRYELLLPRTNARIIKALDTVNYPSATSATPRPPLICRRRLQHLRQLPHPRTHTFVLQDWPLAGPIPPSMLDPSFQSV